MFSGGVCRCFQGSLVTLVSKWGNIMCARTALSPCCMVSGSGSKQIKKNIVHLAQHSNLVVQLLTTVLKDFNQHSTMITQHSAKVHPLAPRVVQGPRKCLCCTVSDTLSHVCLLPQTQPGLQQGSQHCKAPGGQRRYV